MPLVVGKANNKGGKEQTEGKNGSRSTFCTDCLQFFFGRRSGVLQSQWIFVELKKIVSHYFHKEFKVNLRQNPISSPLHTTKVNKK